VCVCVCVCVCEETLSLAIHNSVQSSPHLYISQLSVPQKFSCSLLQSTRRLLSVCCGVGWTAAGTDRQGGLDGAHRYRYQNLSRICQFSNTWGKGESSNKKLVPGAFTGGKDGRFIKLTTLPPS